MKVVILCGGRGTRIRGVNDDLPKPMIPIGDYPILWHIMCGYAAAGFKDFVLCLGYKGHTIKDFFLNYHTRVSDFTIDFSHNGGVILENRRPEIDWRVSLAETGKDTMTGSRLKRIERYIGSDDDFMLTYGDGVSDIDISALVAQHLRRKPIVTVSAVRPPGRFGELDHDGTGRIDAYVALANDMPRTRFDVFNVCSGEPVRVRDFLLMIAERMNANRDNLQFGVRSMREGETQVSYGNNEKAQRYLGWKPSSLMSAIDRDLLADETRFFNSLGNQPLVAPSSMN